ncbi:glycosyltransferase [Psychrobacter alimentarius]|uniref:glycosyltransferase n=1 Tax=Psychrobacter alimentarius TaxID=261164 RepID=UPI003FD1817E
MSNKQYELNHFKKTFVELSEQKDNTVSDLINAIEGIKNSNNYRNSSEVEKLQLKLADSKNENLQLKSIIESLRDKYKDLSFENNKNIKKVSYHVKQIKKHEQKNRKLFELYSKDKEEIFKYQLLVEKLKQEFYSLKDELDKQERRYENLKNQISYKLGNRLVGIRKPKDLLKLPKTLLDDYVSVKAKINESKELLIPPVENSHISLLLSSGIKQSSIFNGSATLPLKSKLSSIVFNQGFKGMLDVHLYGVKPSISVSIELTIRSYQGDCVFKVMPDIKKTHHLASNESMKIPITLNDEQDYRFMEIISASGIIEITFQKTRGVPSFVHINTSNYNDHIIDQSIEISNNGSVRDLQNTYQKPILIPKLKQKNGVFIEAWQINEVHGFKAAKLFVEKYAPIPTQATLNVLEANNFLDDEDRWLELLNKYIIRQNLQPIKLKSGKEPIYHRIISDIGYSINEAIKLSVIMPAFNAEKTIELSIKSVLSQTWRNIELIVINDCSTDHTLSVIQRLAKADERIKVINNPANVGAYVSKNLGLKLATGDYITGHDADDWAHPQRLEKHIRLIQSEDKQPRASITRMIRMEENGFLRMYKISTFCHDGVLRIASITCMFETSFLRNTLGGWDCSRFGADSEIISRAKMVLGEEFKNYEALSMICLDEPNSLTNHPLHGVSKTTGISPTRKFYKEQWEGWHKTIDKSNVYLEFPHLNRKFLVPDGTEIPKENIIKAIRNIENAIADPL